LEARAISRPHAVRRNVRVRHGMRATGGALEDLVLGQAAELVHGRIRPSQDVLRTRYRNSKGEGPGYFAPPGPGDADQEVSVPRGLVPGGDIPPAALTARGRRGD